MKNILYLVLFLLIPSAVMAASATTSATPTLKDATSSGIVQKTATTAATPSQSEDIQEKIKALVKENLSATESTLKEKINQHVLVGYVGLISSINSGNISLTSKDDSLLQITTDDNTTYVKAGLSSKLSSLAISDKIIVMGTLLKEDIVLAKKIVVVKEDPSAMTSATVFAKVTSVDVKKKVIGLSINNKEVLHTLTKKSTIDISEIKVDTRIFAITKKYEGKDYISVAKTI